MTLGGAIIEVTVGRGETRIFSVRVPQAGGPQYIFDDDPDTPVDVPQDIVDEANDLVAAAQAGK